MNYEKRLNMLCEILHPEESYDLVTRSISVADLRGMMYLIDGFVKDEVMEKIMEFMMSADSAEVKSLQTARQFADRYISYVEVELTKDPERIITAVLSGTLLLILDKYEEMFLIDVRTYPTRGVEEPEDDRVLRGSHDGFSETMIVNTALIRRRIRDPQLRAEYCCIGKSSRTDVALLYLKDRVNPDFLHKIKQEIDKIQVNSLSMAQESLNEALIQKGWWNPFPKVRYTERPDAAAAGILEGKIVVIVDNSPTVMVLPCTLFDFIRDTNDFYFPPLIGTYLRWIRILIFFATVFLTPLWYLFAVKNPQMLPESLAFLSIKEPAFLSVLAQLLIFEGIIDGLKLASLNTPSSLSNSFSVIGALILGEFAVSAGLFSAEVIFYMAFVSIGNFTQPSVELSYAFKLCRILLLILTAALNYWGFALGLLLMLFLIFTNNSISDRGYLYPLIPFHAKDLSRIFLRRRKIPHK